MTSKTSWMRTFWTIEAGQLFSQLGSSAVTFALMWWLASSTGSAIMMGISGLVAFLPSALLGPVAGVVADRHNRKAVCIAADLGVGAFAVLYALALAAFDLPPASVIVALLLRGMAQVFQQPAFAAMTPQYVPAEELVRAAGWTQLVASASYVLGPVLGAALFAAFPMSIVLVSDLVGALVAAALLLAAKVPPLERTAPAEPSASPSDDAQPSALARFAHEVKAGIDVYRADRALLLLLVIQTIYLVFYLPQSSFYPLMTSSYFALDAWHGSVVEVAFAAGMFVSAALMGSVVKVRRHMLVAYVGLVATGLASILCGVVPPTKAAWVIFVIGCAAMGGFGNVFSIPVTAYMQERIAPDLLGRAFALMSMTTAVAMPVGLLVASPIAQALGVNAWFALSGLAMAAVAAFGLIRQRAYDSTAAQGASDSPAETPRP